jgi:hypothetical protein
MAAFTCTQGRHRVEIRNSNAADNFNILWCDALNLARRGLITHFAMMHQDVQPPSGWLNVLLEELDARGADLISTAIAIKNRGDVALVSCGVAAADRPEWGFQPFRRFTLRELAAMPETFSAADIGYPNGILMHNNGLWVADMRQPCWRVKTPDGRLRACFDYRREIREDSEGDAQLFNLSEDWAFSEEIARCGARTLITRRVSPGHWGMEEFRADELRGQEHDELTRRWWPEPAVAN